MYTEYDSECPCPRCTDRSGCTGWEPVLGDYFDYDEREKNCNTCKLSSSYDLYGCVECSLCLNDADYQE